MTKKNTVVARQKRFRAHARARGAVRLDAWISRAAHRDLLRLARRWDCTHSAALERALHEAAQRAGESDPPRGDQRP